MLVISHLLLKRTVYCSPTEDSLASVKTEVRRASVKSARQRAEKRASAILSLARLVADAPPVGRGRGTAPDALTGRVQ